MTGQSIGEGVQIHTVSMPSPEEVRKYAELYDRAPEILMEMVLKEREHRLEMEKEEQRLLRKDGRARWAATSSLFSFVLAAFSFLVFRGQWIVAVPLLAILFSLMLLGYTPSTSSERRGVGGGKPPAKSVVLTHVAHGGDGG